MNSKQPPHVSIKALGIEVQKLRIERSMQQKVLASIAGLSQSKLSRIEAGKFDPRLSEVIQIAQALEVEPSALLLRVYKDAA